MDSCALGTTTQQAGLLHKRGCREGAHRQTSYIARRGQHVAARRRAALDSPRALIEKSAAPTTASCHPQRGVLHNLQTDQLQGIPRLAA